MKRRTKIIILILVVMLAISLIMLSFLNRKSAPNTLVSPTPTSDPLSQERSIVSGLAKDFGAKFFTYQKPNDPAYFESIQPYMTPQFFTENKRLTDRETVALSHSTPIESSVDSVKVTDIDAKQAKVQISITTKEGDATRKQTVMLNYLKQDERWSVNSVQIQKTSQGSSDG